MDLASAALRALATQNAWTPALAFGAGLASSFSPCVAPRMLAVAALVANKPAPYTVWVVAVFTAGVVAAYSVLALGGSLIWQLAMYSSYLFTAMAAVMAVLGFLALIFHSKCEPSPLLYSKKSLSSLFLLGASSAATFSPCCMPVIVGAALYARNTGPLMAWLMAASFALGHAAPIALAALGSRTVGLALHRGLQSAARVVAGALMLATAGFYWVLA